MTHERAQCRDGRAVPVDAMERAEGTVRLGKIDGQFRSGKKRRNGAQ